MMISRTMIQLAMGMALVTGSTAAMAERTGWYFGLTGGEAQADLSQAELDEAVESAFFSAGAPVTSGSSTLEDSDTSWSAFAGYRIAPSVALEASYIDFGTAEYRAVGTVDPPGLITSAPASYAADFEASGFTLAVVGTIPLGQMFDLHGRVGVLLADIEISQRAAIDTESGSDTASANSQDFLYGVGAGFYLGERWSFSLDWQHVRDAGDEEDTGETDLDRLSLGVTFRL